MNRISQIVAAAAVLGMAVTALPAQAQYANEFAPAKLKSQGRTTQSVAGSGVVQVKVQVNADGTHKVINVIKSTNPGDNAAAMEIAQTATYTPARRGKTPVTSFYTYELRFNGKSLSQGASSEEAGGATGPIYALVRAGKYKDAIAKANAALLSSPGNSSILQVLGVAQYYDNDYVESATSFNRVSTIRKDYQAIAAQAFATAAVKVAATDAAQSLQFAQKASALSNGNTSKFALGVAELANKQYADAKAHLQSVHDAMTDKDDKSARLNVDQELIEADLATGDTAGANTVAAEMKALDPTSTGASRAIEKHYLQLGADAMNSGDYATALKNFDQAASAAAPADAVTPNTLAALAELKMSKPDFEKAKAYAQKAVAAAPGDPQANYYLGMSYANIYSTSHKSDDKTQALNYLQKADAAAKAAGNVGLALQIESQIKNMPQ